MFNPNNPKSWYTSITITSPVRYLPKTTTTYGNDSYYVLSCEIILMNKNDTVYRAVLARGPIINPSSSVLH
jgi:hypothetical protein